MSQSESRGGLVEADLEAPSSRERPAPAPAATARGEAAPGAPRGPERRPGAGRELRWGFLGRVPYAAAVALQERLRDELRRGEGTEHLLLLEHPHVYTLGRNADAADVVAGAEWLAARGVEVAESDRGGQVTYHGPGQLVGYPIVDLSPDRRDVRRYVRDLEEVLIRTLGDYGVAAEVRPGTALVGVWSGGEKIAAIGVHLSRWITTHGFALNVAPDLSLYDGIVPCGLRAAGVTSIERQLRGAAPPVAEVAARLAEHFAAVFERRLAAIPPGLPGSPGPLGTLGALGPSAEPAVPAVPAPPATA
jgi:lipoyl(octanoyl) transferase